MDSSYIYAKNSDMQEIDSAKPSNQFDFKTAESDPFNYLPDTNLGKGCGAIKKDDNLII